MKIATLFSGVGSPEFGAKRVYRKVKNVFACEIDKFARQSYLANHDIDEEHFYKDIYELDATKYRGKVDVLVGGSPCQSFSIAGLRKGINDKRGELIYEFIRVLDEVKPPIFIYENVRGFTSIDGGRTFKQFQEALRKIGYFIHSDILNTKDYGVPQNRERVYITGFLDSEVYYSFNYAPKQKLAKKLADILENDVDDKYYVNREIKNYKSQANTIHDINKFSSTICAGSHGYALGYIKVAGSVDIKSNDSNKRVYSIDGIAPTITTMQGGHQEPKILRKSKIRKLTPRECLRLQDFPDTFKFVCSDSQIYKQAGNSMSVNILEMIFRQIEKAKNKELKKETLF